MNAEKLVRKTVEVGGRGFLSDGSLGKIEKLGEFVDDDSGVSLRELIFDDGEVLLRTSDAGYWEQLKRRHEGVGFEDLCDGEGIMRAEEVEEFIVKLSKLVEIAVELGRSLLPGGDIIVQLLFTGGGER